MIVADASAVLRALADETPHYWSVCSPPRCTHVPHLIDAETPLVTSDAKPADAGGHFAEVDVHPPR